tara:strand:+ start:898 stop:1392 length:495 start_codon:yes stop_codon:yes gene_type:complete
MSQKQSKRDKVKKAIKSGGQKVAKFTKSRIVGKFIPLLGLIAIFTPGKAFAFSIGGEFGKNASFFAVEFGGMREVTRQGVSAIPDPSLRTAVSTIGSIAALIGGVSCGIGSAVCSGMGYEQKAMVCLHGLGICSGVASGMHDADPVNPVTVPGKLASEAVRNMA